MSDNPAPFALAPALVLPYFYSGVPNPQFSATQVVYPAVFGNYRFAHANVATQNEPDSSSLNPYTHK